MVKESTGWSKQVKFILLTSIDIKKASDTFFIFSPTQLSPFKTILAGGAAGIANWIVALPIDVGKSRFQTAPEGKYKNLLEVYTELIRKDGIMAFYKGKFFEIKFFNYK